MTYPIWKGIDKRLSAKIKKPHADVYQVITILAKLWLHNKTKIKKIHQIKLKKITIPVSSKSIALIS